ncbi:MAG: hypothetical protein AABY22_10270 [Nanoarchaeota archaeon]
MIENIKKEDIEKIREFYSKCELYLPSNPSWRFYLFKLSDNSYKRFHISSIQQLRKLLVMFAPLKVYFSCSQWVNVQNVRGNIKTSSYPIFINSDVIFDIDADNLEEAKATALEVISRIGTPDKIVLCARGFHLWYLDSDNKRAEYVSKTEDIKNVDIKCTKNKFGVFALPLTLKKGKTCPFISLEQLKGDLECHRQTIYNHLDISDTLESQEAIPGNEAFRRHESKMIGMETRGTILSFPNKVKKGLFIPVLIYDKRLRGLKNEIFRLFEHYELGDLYCFENDSQIAFISLKVVDRRRLQKILNSSRSITKSQFMKFNFIWFEYSQFKAKAKINFDTQKFYRASLKHYSILSKMGFPEDSHSQIDGLVGNEYLKTYEVKLS